MKINGMKLFSGNVFWLLKDKLMNHLEDSQARFFWVLMRGKMLLHSHGLIYSWSSVKLQIIWNVLICKNNLMFIWNSNVDGNPGCLFTKSNDSHLEVLHKDRGWGTHSGTLKWPHSVSISTTAKELRRQI